MMRSTILSFFLCLLFTVNCAFAEETAPYRLSSEDSITVVVLRHPEFSGDFFIPPDGVVDLPGIGKISVSGKTITELTHELTKSLSERLNKPEISVSVRAPRMNRIYVLGAVAKPGVYDLKSNWNIAESIAAAGGLTLSEKDCQATLLRSASGKHDPIPLKEVLSPQLSSNYPLAPGDVIMIEKVESFTIYVMGAVKNPGPLELPKSLGLMEALALAGGFTLSNDEVSVSIIRKGKAVSLIDLSEVERNNNAGDLPLMASDVLVVEPLRSEQIMVTGRVNKPGQYNLKKGEGLLEAITLAGGPADNASLSRIQVIKKSGPTEVVNIASAYWDGKNENNVKLESGDLVIVPEAKSGVVVLGYVNAPGFYPVREDRTISLSEAISLAKGPDVKKGGVREIAILRGNADGKPIRTIVDLKKYFQTGDAKYNTEVGPGDIVYVPDSGKPDWNLVFQSITSAALVYNAIK